VTAAASKSASRVPFIDKAASLQLPSLLEWQQQQQLANCSVASSAGGRRGGSSSIAGSEASDPEGGQVVLQLRLRPSIFLLPVLPPEHLLAWVWSILMLFMDMIYVAFAMPMNMVGASGWPVAAWGGLLRCLCLVSTCRSCLFRGFDCHVGC
jgi:hypothetical protein